MYPTSVVKQCNLAILHIDGIEVMTKWVLTVGLEDDGFFGSVETQHIHDDPRTLGQLSWCEVFFRQVT